MKLSEIRKLTQVFLPQHTQLNQKEIYEHLTALGFDPGNFYQELEMESKFVDTHRDTSYSNANVNLHSHTFYEILYCRNSCGAEYLVGSDRYRLQKGDIVLIPPGISHRPLLPEKMSEPYVRDVLWISSDFFKLLRIHFPEEDLYPFDNKHLIRTTGTAWEFLGDKFRQGVMESEKKDLDWEIAVIANTVQIIVQLHRAICNRTAHRMKAEKPELLDQVMAYVEDHLDEKINLADVSRQFYVSESTISQLFRKKMGVSFYRCVTQRRLIAAKNLILDGTVLEHVADKTGFSDYSTFYRAFKSEFGISPRQFRNQHTPE